MKQVTIVAGIVIGIACAILLYSRSPWGRHDVPARPLPQYSVAQVRSGLAHHRSAWIGRTILVRAIVMSPCPIGIPNSGGCILIPAGVPRVGLVDMNNGNSLVAQLGQALPLAVAPARIDDPVEHLLKRVGLMPPDPTPVLLLRSSIQTYRVRLTTQTPCLLEQISGPCDVAYIGVAIMS